MSIAFRFNKRKLTKIVKRLLRTDITDAKGILKIRRDIDGVKFADKEGKDELSSLKNAVDIFLSEMKKNPESFVFLKEVMGIEKVGQYIFLADAPD